MICKSGIALLVLAPVFSPVLSAQAVVAEKANDAKIDALLKQMTLEEKVSLIRGSVEPAATNQGQAGYLPGVPRLGIPPLRFADGPPGVLTRVAGQAQTATMGVAATWSVRDAEQNGATIGKEARSLGIDVVLQPFINIDRDITFTRSYNTLGEDPFLNGAMGAAEIRGEQAQGVMSQAKHFVAYDSDSYNIFVDQQALHEVYVAPFAAAIDAGVASIMCSYNKVNGVFACGNQSTLTTILRKELGFKGFVTSDWGGVHDVHFLNQGLTMEMPGEVPDDSPFAGMMHTYFRTAPDNTGPPIKPNLAALGGMLGGSIPEEASAKGMDLDAFPRESDPATLRSALADGSVNEATITAAARQVLYEIDRFGYLDGKQKHAVTPQDTKAAGEIIQKTAEDAAVLLKNEGSVLPLKRGQNIALIGPTALQVDSIGTFGERSPGMTELQVGPLAAMKRLAPDAKVSFAVADDMTGVPIAASLLSHDGKPGLARMGAQHPESVDATLDFTLKNGKALPPNSVVAPPCDRKPGSCVVSLRCRVLGQLLGEAELREIRHPHRVEDAVQVIELVLHHVGLQPVSIAADRVAVAIDTTVADAHMTRHGGAQARDGKTPLPAQCHLIPQYRDHRVDHDRRRHRRAAGALGRQVEDEQAPGHVHLRRGQADARRVQHGVDHVGGQATHLRRPRIGHVRRALQQDGVAHAGDFQQGHWSIEAPQLCRLGCGGHLQRCIRRASPRRSGSMVSPRRWKGPCALATSRAWRPWSPSC